MAIVEGQKSLRFEFESAGDVEAVKSTNTQFRPIAPAEIAAYLEGIVGHGSFEPQSGEPVTPQVVEDFVGIGVRNFATKDLLRPARLQSFKSNNSVRCSLSANLATRVILSGFSPSNCAEKTKRKPTCQTCQLRAP